MALLLGLRAGRLAHQQCAHDQLWCALRVHASDLGGLLPGRLLELQSDPAEPRGGWTSRCLGIRGRRTGSNRPEDDVRRVALGIRAAPRVGVQRERQHRRPGERRADLRVGEEHRWQLALERIHRRLQRHRARVSGELGIQLGPGVAGLARAALPRAEHAERQQHSVLAAVRLGTTSRVLLLDAQHTATAAWPVRRRSGLQHPAGAPPDDQPPEPEPGGSRHLLPLRRPVRAGRGGQSDELAHGLDARAAGGHPVSLSVVPGLAVGAAGAPPVSAVPGHQHGGGRRRSERAIELPCVRAQGGKALRIGAHVPELVCVLEDLHAAFGPRQCR